MDYTLIPRCEAVRATGLSALRPTIIVSILRGVKEYE